MNIINLNIQTIIVFIILLVLGTLFLYLTYKKNKNKISIVFLFLSYLFLIVTIFGFRGDLKNNNNFENTGNILFALDVSKSMNVFDIEYDKDNYSRLESSKYLIDDFLDNNLNNNYGLLIFAGESLEILPFTKDIDLYKTILSGVDNKNLTKAGTDLSGVFSSALTFFENEETIGTVVILSDGGDELSIDKLKQKVQRMKEKQLEVIIVGIGSSSGDYIPDGRDMYGNIKYKTYNGEKVLSKLNEKDLKKLSRENDFDYIRFDDILEIKKIEKLITQNTIKALSINNFDNREDLTRKLILVSFILFLLFLGIEYLEQKK